MITGQFIPLPLTYHKSVFEFPENDLPGWLDRAALIFVDFSNTAGVVPGQRASYA